MKKPIKTLLVFASIYLFNACATFAPQYKNKNNDVSFPDKEIVHSFYLIGDAGNSPLGTSSKGLQAFKTALSKAPKQSTALFLGDNIYPKGMPKKGDESREFAEHQLNIQTDAVSEFKGQTIFIPGNHDWYSNGVKGLKRQEKYIEDILGKNTFLPENGCPIEKVNISEDIVLIIVDSEWYLADWNKNPTINDDCDIKTRTKFFDEFEGEIKKARGKTTIVAMHHPIFTNGPHGGKYSFTSHLKPLPVLGSLKNLVRKTGGVTTVDIQNQLYNTFRKRIITLSQENDKTIFVSGHDHNLQYLIQDHIPQIISGSGSKETATRNVGNGQFAYGSEGYARLDVFKDGSSHIRFYTAKSDNIVYQSQVIAAPNQENSGIHYESIIQKAVTASIYSEEETTKSGFHKAIWGDRYREAYSTKVTAPTVSLDTLFGGLIPVRKGGGHQSKSLRLKDKEGREYVMRALRKSAIQYIQAVAFQEQYIEGQLEDSYTEGIVMDVFTGSHPYAPFTIGTLANAVGVFHTNPVMYYVPKQKQLGAFNKEFGDALYMIEERASSGHGDKASFGFSNKLISTDDLLKQLNKDEDIIVDETAYIKARLFDMFIGDWDRHGDQWRWARFKENKQTVYRPVPRDRDQAFSIMADGGFMSLATRAIPAMRMLQSFDDDILSTKWFNLEPFPLDVALINQSGRDVWDEQVQHIVMNITDDVIDKAFTYFPPEVNQETIQDIKQKLKARRSNLQEMSNRYYAHVNKFAIIKGTNKDDWFDVERMSDGMTKVSGYRLKKGEKADLFHERTYSSKDTKEIWIYGLDDEDVFKVFGTGDDLIKIRLIGGQNKDTYNIVNGKRIKSYDYKSKANTFITDKGSKKLTDNYEINVYDHKKLKYNSNELLPTLGFNPDDGFKIGVSNTYTNQGFVSNPFKSQHHVSGAYYFATQGFDLAYKGEFAHVIGTMNLGIEAKFTSPNYAVNFFGFGNSTPNPEADENDGLDVNLNYNRVKLSTLKVAPSLIWKGRFGSQFEIGLSYELIEVESTEGRFINDAFIGDDIEVENDFYGINTKFQYNSVDNAAFPTMGMLFALQTGYKRNASSDKGFGYIIPELGFNYKLVPNGQLVLATKVKGHFNLDNGFEFYQGANIGANNGLRGYRNERFTGKSAFVQTSDLRLNLRKVKTGLLPLNIGVYGGFDYGRVWVSETLLLDAAHHSDNWNTSIGGGVFANAADMVTLNLSTFYSEDGLRFAFKLGFGF